MFSIIRYNDIPIVKYLKSMLRYIPPHKHDKKISLYVASFYDNICNNTPAKIESELKKLFPEMHEFFDKLHEKFPDDVNFIRSDHQEHVRCVCQDNIF